jgi:ribosomal protein S12 methylthiotransferase accessory factor
MTCVLPRPLRRAHSRYTGIVRSLEECLHGTSEPALFRAACFVGSNRALLGSPLDHLTGIGGTGRTRAEAAAAAIGEALERYSATYVPHDRIVVASATELGDSAVDPRRFALFSDRQYASDGFPFEPFTPTLRVPWVCGWSIDDGREAWLPAELVFLGDVVAAGRPRIGYATSSGMACAEDSNEALTRSLCELLERDAFMIVWANRLSLPKVDVETGEALAALEARVFAPTGLAYSAVDLSPFHRLPSVLAVVRAPPSLPGAVGVGAGTAPTLERAWWKALAEAFAARAAGAKLALLDRASDSLESNFPESIVSFEGHIRFHADHARAHSTAFLDESAERVAASTIPELCGASAGSQIRELTARVGAAGATAYAVDVTSPDVRELGLVVLKALAPELCSLDVVHSARFLGGRRLYDAPVQLGFRSNPIAEDDVNPEPHPFP